MKKKFLLIIVFCAVILLVCYGLTQAQVIMQKQGEGLKNTHVYQIVTHPNNPHVLFCHDSQTLYVSFNNGETLEPIQHKRRIYDVFAADEILLLSSDDGLMGMDFATYQWEMLLSVSGEDPIIDAVAYAGVIYAVSEERIFRKDPFSTQFHTILKALNHEKFVQGFILDGQFILATQQALLSINGNDWTELLKIGINKEELSELIKDVITSRGQWIAATERGFYTSHDKGRNWKLMDGIALNGKTVQALYGITVQLPDQRHGTYHKGPSEERELLIGTLNGLFIYKDKTLIRVLDGLESQTIYDVLYYDDRIVAATEKGLFQSRKASPEPSISHPIVLDELWQEEPSIDQVQNWAVELAEVQPEKIQQWRRLAKTRALFPSVSLGVDGGHDWGGSDSVYGSSSGALFVGPDDKSYGGDIGWDVSLSWDLADFIWSTDQTTIDGRSKLMVELREDILDQVTRYFFERRRLIAEAYQSEGENPNQRFHTQMRVDELTAYIDGYTGGKFSAYINLTNKGEKNGNNIGH